jgi:hypothetical protein
VVQPFNNQAAAGSVYPELARHQRDEPWFGRDLVAELQAWAERYIVEFKLDIPEIVLCIEQLPRTRYAQFRNGHNKFGLRGEIAFNTLYLDGSRSRWEVLGTLLHELLHGWQQAHGTPGKRNFHNSEFRAKAAELGLDIDRRGVTAHQAHSRFKELLLRHGVDVPIDEVQPVTVASRSTAKLKKWTCGCVNIRAAVEINLRCLNCGGQLVRDDTPGQARRAPRSRQHR